MQSGWELDRFKQNPIGLLDHDHSKAVGTWTDLQVQFVNGVKALTGTLEWAPHGTSDFADRAWREVEAGVRKGISVGLLPKDVEPRNNGRGLTFNRMELIEASSVNIPSCPVCLSQVVKGLGGSVDDDTIDDTIVIDDATVDELATFVDERVRQGLGEVTVTEADVARMVNAELMRVLPDVLRTAVRSGFDQARGRLPEFGWPPVGRTDARR